MQFKEDETRFIVVAAGRRSRKTLIGKRKVIERAITHPDTRHFLSAPTNQQAKAIFWQDLKQYTTFLRKYKNETQMMVRLLNDSEIHVAGLDKPERIEGSPWHSGLITEYASVKSHAWTDHLRPVFSDTNGWCILEGVPEGRNHFYDQALYAAGGVLPETQPIAGAYATNPDDPEWAFYSWFSADVLTDKEIAAVKRQLDARTYQQEYEAQFLSYEGVMYYTFSPANVSAEIAQVDPSSPLYLTCDFNKQPMVWEVAQPFYYAGQKALKFVGEVAIPYNAKTPHAVKAFLDQYQTHRRKTVYITGDASANYEDHKSHTTDYLLIREALEDAGWHVKITVPSKNPSVNNRTNLVCAMLESYTGERTLFAHPDCAYLIRDWERVEGDGKGGKEKDADKWLTHASDAADYLLWQQFKDLYFQQRVVQS